MTTLLRSFRRILAPIHPLPPGVYHYQSPPDDPRNYRLHLRLEPEGHGVLIVNASTILHLNQTAAEYAYYLVQNQPAEQVAQEMASRYNVSHEQALQDYQDLVDRLLTLVETPDLDPVTFLGFDRQPVGSREISAPYRLDCALTYRLPGGEAPESVPGERARRELSTEEWKSALDKAWDAGIPHVVFTGGEPTLRDDLPELLTHVESKGMVSGLLSNGLRLANEDYLNTLLQTGLDHLMLILRPKNDQSWLALQNVLAVDLYAAVHLTLTSENNADIPEWIARLSSLGVKALSLTASDPALETALQNARQQAAYQGLELVWNLPVPYSALNPVAFERKGGQRPQGYGRLWLYVEPDGDVLPTQGADQVLGNLLTDPWQKIWKN